MKNSLRAIGFLLVGIIIFGALIMGAGTLLVSALYIQGLSSAIVLAIFLIVVYRTRALPNDQFVFIIFVFALVGMLFDTWGNFITNKPMEWIASFFGELVIDNQVTNLVPGEYTVNYSLSLMTPDGVLHKIPTVLLYVYRFIEYSITYTLISSLLRLVLPKKKQNDQEDTAKNKS